MSLIEGLEFIDDRPGRGGHGRGRTASRSFSVSANGKNLELRMFPKGRNELINRLAEGNVSPEKVEGFKEKLQGMICSGARIRPAVGKNITSDKTFVIGDGKFSIYGKKNILSIVVPGEFRVNQEEDVTESLPMKLTEAAIGKMKFGDEEKYVIVFKVEADGEVKERARKGDTPTPEFDNDDLNDDTEDLEKNDDDDDGK